MILHKGPHSVHGAQRVVSAVDLFEVSEVRGLIGYAIVADGDNVLRAHSGWEMNVAFMSSASPQFIDASNGVIIVVHGVRGRE